LNMQQMHRSGFLSTSDPQQAAPTDSENAPTNLEKAGYAGLPPPLKA